MLCCLIHPLIPLWLFPLHSKYLRIFIIILKFPLPLFLLCQNTLSPPPCATPFSLLITLSLSLPPGWSHDSSYLNSVILQIHPLTFFLILYHLHLFPYLIPWVLFLLLLQYSSLPVLSVDCIIMTPTSPTLISKDYFASFLSVPLPSSDTGTHHFL